MLSGSLSNEILYDKEDSVRTPIESRLYPTGSPSHSGDTVYGPVCNYSSVSRHAHPEETGVYIA